MEYHFLKKHWRNTVYSNVWIALGAAATTWQSLLLFDTEVNILYVLFVGFATLATYNFQRIIKFRNRPEYVQAGRNNWLFRNRKTLLLITLIAGIGTALSALYLPFFAFPTLLIMALISLLYVVRFIPRKDKKLALRDLPLMKVFLIALVWTVVSVVIPLQNSTGFEFVVTPQILVLALLEKFSFVLAITIPFDIRDVEYDDPSQQTIPQLLGVRKSIHVAVFFAILSFIASAMLFITGSYSWITLSAFALSTSVNLYFITNSGPQKSEMFFAGGVDGTLLCQTILVFLSLSESYI